MRYFPLLLASVIVVGCLSAEATMLDSAPPDRPEVDVSQVVVYSDTNSVECPYDRVALIKSEGQAGPVEREEIIQKTKEKAAKIRANTVIIEDISVEDVGEEKLDQKTGVGDFLALYERRPCD